MFVELENGELLNLNYVVRIFIEEHAPPAYRVTVEYVSGGSVCQGSIHRGTVQQCNFILTALKNSLDVVSHGIGQ